MGPEAKIEKAVRDYARSKNCLVYKFTSPSNRSVPDDIFFPWDKPCFLIEFKGPKGKLTEMQNREIHRIKAHGHAAYVVYSVEEGIRIIDAHT